MRCSFAWPLQAANKPATKQATSIGELATGRGAQTAIRVVKMSISGAISITVIVMALFPLGFPYGVALGGFSGGWRGWS